MWSGCAVGSQTYTQAAPELCESEDPLDRLMCDQYPGAYNLHKGFEDGADHGGLIGLARDGHLVYGPYTENGELWSQDQLDICGGTYLSDG